MVLPANRRSTTRDRSIPNGVWERIRGKRPNETSSVRASTTTQIDSTATDDQGKKSYQETLTDEAEQKNRIDWHLKWMCGWMCGLTMLAFLLGSVGFSPVWLVVLCLAVGGVWREKVQRALGESLLLEATRARRRKATAGGESAEWVNFLLSRWSQFAASGIKDWMKESLDPTLREARPGFVESIEVKQFTIGEETPAFRNVRAYDLSLLEPRSYDVALEGDVSMACEQFCLVLKTRIGGKGLMGVDLDIAVERLHIRGRLWMSLTLGKDVPWPHFQQLAFCFTEKPQVWFDIRLIKGVQVMELPILRSWLHNMVSDWLTAWLVDPSRWDVDLSTEPDPVVPELDLSLDSRFYEKAAGVGLDKHQLSKGVLTITVSGVNKPGEDDRWLVVSLGSQKHVVHPYSSRWQETHSFLVHDLGVEILHVRIKCKKFISYITLAQFELPLSSYGLDNSRTVETCLKKGTKGATAAGIAGTVNLKLEFDVLPSIRLDIGPSVGFDTVDSPDGGSAERTKAGVLFVCVHGAELDASGCGPRINPYCAVFLNKKKLKASTSIRDTRRPCWEMSLEILISDVDGAMLSFVVCSRESARTKVEFLGVANMVLSKEEPNLVHQKLPIVVNNQENGEVQVSVVFRSVPSVENSVGHRMGNFDSLPDSLTDIEDSPNVIQRLLPGRAESVRRDTLADIFNADGLMELTISSAKALVAKDFNGFSDPYCEVKLDSELKLKTSIKKRTLDPVWDESVTISLPNANQTITVTVWDYDTFSMRDFLGSISLNLEDIRQISESREGKWFPLKDTKSGEILIKVKIIAEDLQMTGMLERLPSLPQKDPSWVKAQLLSLTEQSALETEEPKDGHDEAEGMSIAEAKSLEEPNKDSVSNERLNGSKSSLTTTILNGEPTASAEMKSQVPCRPKNHTDFTVHPFNETLSENFNEVLINGSSEEQLELPMPAWTCVRGQVTAIRGLDRFSSNKHVTLHISLNRFNFQQTSTAHRLRRSFMSKDGHSWKNRNSRKYPLAKKKSLATISCIPTNVEFLLESPRGLFQDSQVLFEIFASNKILLLSENVPVSKIVPEGWAGQEEMHVDLMLGGQIVLNILLIPGKGRERKYSRAPKLLRSLSIHPFIH